jgi:hypothetical protein
MAAIPSPPGPQQDALGQVVLFQAADGQVPLDVRLGAHTVWLSQAQMAELFGRECSVISKHIGNVFREGELTQESTCAKFALVQTEGNAHLIVLHQELKSHPSNGAAMSAPRPSELRLACGALKWSQVIRG